MPKLNDTGVYQLKNGYWGFCYAIVVNNKRVERKRNLDEQGNPYKTKTSAVKARRAMIEKERNSQLVTPKIEHVTVQQAYSRNYLNAEQYDKLCKNKDTKIHMPKMKIDEDTDIVTFSDEQMITINQSIHRYVARPLKIRIVLADI